MTVAQPSSDDPASGIIESKADKRMREWFEAAAPYRIGQSFVSVASVPPQLQRPGLHRLVISRAKRAACFFGQPYLIAGRYVQTYAIYYDCEDVFTCAPDAFTTRKIVWRDETTGYDCIIMRDPEDRLCSFVGVPEGHGAHGLSCAELRAKSSDGAFEDVLYADHGSHCSERRSSLAQEGRSVSNRMVELSRDPVSFHHLTLLVRDRHWWFGSKSGSSPPAPLHYDHQFDLPLPPAANSPIDEEASAFMEATRLALALSRLDPTRRRSDQRGR